MFRRVKLQNIFPIFISFLMLVKPAMSEETFSSVMQRMKPVTAVRIAYQETRYLELLDEPWIGSGYLYSMAPDIMIKEQYYPAREIMGVNGQNLYYYDPVNDVRHQGEMDDNQAGLHVTAFKALTNGDRQLMDKMYRTEFESGADRWSIGLTSKNEDESGLRIIISGMNGKEADSIIVWQADGDRSEFTLTKDKQGQEMEKKVRRLLKELQADSI